MAWWKRYSMIAAPLTHVALKVVWSRDVFWHPPCLASSLLSCSSTFSSHQEKASTSTPDQIWWQVVQSFNLKIKIQNQRSTDSGYALQNEAAIAGPSKQQLQSLLDRFSVACAATTKPAQAPAPCVLARSYSPAVNILLVMSTNSRYNRGSVDRLILLVLAR